MILTSKIFGHSMRLGNETLLPIHFYRTAVFLRHTFEFHMQLCHVLQFECRFKEAVEFMEECSATWNSCSTFM